MIISLKHIPILTLILLQIFLYYFLFMSVNGSYIHPNVPAASTIVHSRTIYGGAIGGNPSSGASFSSTQYSQTVSAPSRIHSVITTHHPVSHGNPAPLKVNRIKCRINLKVIHQIIQIVDSKEVAAIIQTLLTFLIIRHQKIFIGIIIIKNTITIIKLEVTKIRDRVMEGILLRFKIIINQGILLKDPE